MPLDSHLDELRRRHRNLDRSLNEAQSRPSVPDTELAQMKRRKLHLKDTINRMESRA